jgi:non-canonical (house-cleaning) NTP pyrophosphatase
MKISVGTTSDQKLGYLKEVLDELKISADLFPQNVASDVSEQPMSAEETRQGSINRARNASSLCRSADLAIGIEVGYHPDNDGKYEIFCYATIVDRDGVQFISESHRFLLPDFHQKVLQDNQNLGEHVRRFIAESNDAEMKIIGEDIRSRKPYIVTALKKVFEEYKNAEQ